MAYKFILSLPHGFTVDSEYDIEGHVSWPNYSQAEPVRYKGVFDTYEKAQAYAESFSIYKYILKYYYVEPYDSFEDEYRAGNEFPKYYISIYDAEDAACAELRIAPGDRVVNPKYIVENLDPEDLQRGFPPEAYKYMLMHRGDCLLDSVEAFDEYYLSYSDAEYAAWERSRKYTVDIDDLPYELVPIEVLHIDILPIDEQDHNAKRRNTSRFFGQNRL